MRPDLARLLNERHGHFEFESGHHGDLWLELESLCRDPRAVRPLADELAAKLVPHGPGVICGPLVEGAFVGLMVAERLGVEFVYAEREVDLVAEGMYPVRYRLPAALRDLNGRRVAIANDVINAGSAVRGALADARECSAQVVAIGTLLALGPAARELARAARTPLEALAAEPGSLWTPEACPLCASGAPLVRHPGS